MGSDVLIFTRGRGNQQIVSCHKLGEPRHLHFLARSANAPTALRRDTPRAIASQAPHLIRLQVELAEHDVLRRELLRLEGPLCGGVLVLARLALELAAIDWLLAPDERILVLSALLLLLLVLADLAPLVHLHFPPQTVRVADHHSEVRVGDLLPVDCLPTHMHQLKVVSLVRLIAVDRAHLFPPLRHTLGVHDDLALVLPEKDEGEGDQEAPKDEGTDARFVL